MLTDGNQRRTEPGGHALFPSLSAGIADTDRASELIRHQPGSFVPNLGQWDHAASFVHRSGPLTLFLQDRGWVIDLVERQDVPPPAGTEPDTGPDSTFRGAALRMSFEGGDRRPVTSGENELPGYHNYFLGNDASRWRTGVPRFGSVRYGGMYPGIDVRVREANGVPEYDLLLAPGADLSAAIVRVDGAECLSIENDGSLVIHTKLGPLTQPAPKTWETGADGQIREVTCEFTLLGANRFGFRAPGWSGSASLTIDPGLVWSTYLGGSHWEWGGPLAVDARGVVTVVGFTLSTDYPTTTGAYDGTYNQRWDISVTQLDPRKRGAAQLVYSTFLGGHADDFPSALEVDTGGVVTLTGSTKSNTFPTTLGAYDTSHNGASDAFLCRFDPSLAGPAQLVYSTFLGGTSYDYIDAVSSIDAFGVITLAGGTTSTDYPTTNGAYDRTHNGDYDVVISRLDPSRVGSAQLVGSTFLGGSSGDRASDLVVNSVGVATVAGTTSSTNFPTTGGAYDTTFGGYSDGFVARLDPFKAGPAQLIYSTFLGGSSGDPISGIAVDPGGVVTATGVTSSPGFPTTRGAYDTTFNGDADAFISRLDPAKIGTAQLTYSTFLGGTAADGAIGVHVAGNGIITVCGGTTSTDLPTTTGAYDTTFNGTAFYYGDAYVTRLDPHKTGTDQLVYSTFLGGTSAEFATGFAVDASGVVTLTGNVGSTAFPVTTGAYDSTHNGGRYDTFVSRLDMGMPLYGDVHEIPIATGGTQRLTVNAGKAHANRPYWIFGSMTGTKGFTLLGVHIPLDPDVYTGLAMNAVNGRELTNFRGTLDANGLATARLNVPAIPTGGTLYHAYVVYDASGKFHMASNPVPLRLR